MAMADASCTAAFSTPQPEPMSSETTSPGRLGVVVIGRNEGDRLRRCLDSLRCEAEALVYVDSGSTDGSQVVAQQTGAKVLALDMNTPFTAARARNAGFKELLRLADDCTWVQFIDGDCEVVSGWLNRGRQFLSEHPDVAAVCGRRRERFPDASVYNWLCDVEWSVVEGPARYFGGDVMLRVDAFSAAGGYLDALIAGEEPELALRLRRLGWKLYALDEDMTYHDADMLRFTQWWRRMKRAGWAYAAGAHLHGAGPERHWVKPTLQIWLWTLVPCLLALLGMIWVGPWALLALLIYPLQCIRLALRAQGNAKQRIIRSLSLVVGRFAEFSGQMRYLFDLWQRRHPQLIEYK